ncbi:MAG: undecaprenyldiphospho-muramoylpentapeptide beta-N-acetylglucosaminyltransferase [Calditrichaeota bacterium]|nr:undecaprenyldiphospho-muramoylpentapeptide beta-N-acetylglucosaminyltransferase [Calditrichota bacterium]MCB9368509.1 undecaprenyldiphospho-muramoylpentapeptide beta-N-acetylglucosaminyltransferase [Calditrichota bacterium]
MRVVLTGGGTGGHVYPALAIAEAIREIDHDVDVHFLGTPTGFESKAVPRAGETLHQISSGGIVGKGMAAKLRGAAKAGLGVVQSLSILRSLKPDVIVGTGGFVMAPVLVAARILRIPFYIQEQNSFPGLTTRKFAKNARTVFTAYSEAGQFLPGANVELTGNPLRKSIVDCAEESVSADSSEAQLLITGGSLGAQSINNAVSGALMELCELAQVTWQFGRSGIPSSTPNELVNELTNSGKLISASFFEDMPQRYAKANLIVCRSGAMTLSEVALFGLPAVLVPYPHAAHNHQATNAAAYVRSGAATAIEDRVLTPTTLLEACATIVGSKAKQTEMRSAMRTHSKPDAAFRIVRAILK